MKILLKTQIWLNKNNYVINALDIVWSKVRSKLIPGISPISSPIRSHYFSQQWKKVTTQYGKTWEYVSYYKSLIRNTQRVITFEDILSLMSRFFLSNICTFLQSKLRKEISKKWCVGKNNNDVFSILYHPLLDLDSYQEKKEYESMH